MARNIKSEQAGEIIRKAARDANRDNKSQESLSIDVFDISSERSAFGELLEVTPEPVIQFDALQGLQTTVIETFTSTGGSVGVKDDHGGKEFFCSTGTSVGGYGVVRSKRVIRYRPGQGCLVRFTARFDAPLANCIQRAGAINVGTELSFGYNGGSSFGILYRTGGRQEIRTLTITTPAGGNETLTLTLNDVEYTISLTSGTAEHNARQIVNDDSFSAAFDAWQSENTVIFIGLTPNALTGTFSISSTGVFAGTFAQTAAGRAVTDTFIEQADWNIQTLQGTTAAFNFDPSKGNIFQIRYKYLGYGQITFSIMNPNTGKMIEVHEITYPNNYEVPNLETPVLNIGWVAASLGSSGTDVRIHGASAAGFIEGPVRFNKNPASHSNTKSGIGTNLTNVIQFRVRPSFNGYVNLQEVFPLLATFAVEGTKPAVCEVHLNPTVAGEINWTTHEGINQIIEYDTAGTTISSDTEIVVIPLAKSASDKINLSEYNLRLSRGDVLALAVRATSSSTEATASMTWVED